MFRCLELESACQSQCLLLNPLEGEAEDKLKREKVRQMLGELCTNSSVSEAAKKLQYGDWKTSQNTRCLPLGGV